MKKQILYLIFIAILICINPAFAQNRFIRGSVMSQEGKAIEGATVRVTDNGQMAVTKSDGSYIVIATFNSKSILFSASGYLSLTMQIPLSSDIVDVQLAEDFTGNSENYNGPMAITVAGQTAGVHVPKINSNELTQGNERSMLNAMQGKAAGAFVSSNGGASGSSARIQLRGITSFYGDNQPLVVVDGIPIDNGSYFGMGAASHLTDFGNRANDIDPNNIETVDVLTGAMAAALYGSRASNGALIITTKTGHGTANNKNKTAVNFVSSYSFENVIRFPELQNKFGQGINGIADSKEKNSWGPVFDNSTEQPWGQMIDGEQRMKFYSAANDNYKSIFHTGHTINNFVSVNGGGEKTGYYFSFGDLRNTGVTSGQDYRRNTFQANGFANLSNHFTSDFKLGFTRSATSANTMGNDFSFYEQVLQTPTDIALKDLKDINNKYNTPQGYYGNSTINPYFILQNTANKNQVNNFTGAGSLNYNYRNLWDVTCRLGSNTYFDDRNGYEPLLTGVTGQNAARAKNAGLYYEDHYKITENNFDLFVKTKRKLGENVILNVLAGYNIKDGNMTVSSNQTNGLANAGFYSLSNSAGPLMANNASINNQMQGVYLNALLGFKNALFITATARNDWAKLLPEEHRSILNSAANASLLMHKIFTLPEWMPFFKIRGGAAQTGRVPDLNRMAGNFVPGSMANGYNNAMVASPFGSAGGFERGNWLNNDGLKAEMTLSYEVGIDIDFAENHRYGISATCYKTNSSNLLVYLPVTAMGKYTAQTINSGRMSNNGVELTLRLMPVITKDVRWSVNAMFFSNTNKVTGVNPAMEMLYLGMTGNTASIASTGHAFGQFYATGYSKSPDGKVIVDSATGLPVPSATKNLGSFLPKFTLSFNSTVQYKNWKLYVQVDHRNGGKIYSRTAELTNANGSAANTLSINGSGSAREAEVLSNSVYMGYDGQYHENLTAANVQNYWTNNAIAARNILDATYTKLREVALSYSIPADVIRNLPFGSITLGFSARNLLLFTPKSNKYIDPETNSFGTGNMQGFERGSLPGLRSYSFSLRAMF